MAICNGNLLGPVAGNGSRSKNRHLCRILSTFHLLIHAVHGPDRLARDQLQRPLFTAWWSLCSGDSRIGVVGGELEDTFWVHPSQEIH